MNEIELDVLWHTDDTKDMENMGIDYDIDEVEVRKITFYGISHISVNHWDDDHEFTNIYSLSGEVYISRFKYNKVKSEIAYQMSRQ